MLYFRRFLKLYLCCHFFFCGTVLWSQEVWTECRVKIPLFEGFQLQPEVQARFRHEPSLQNYAFLYRLGFKYRINETWRLGSAFRITDERDTDEIMASEIPERKRYTLDTYADFPLENERTTVENRLRCQFSQTRKLNYNYYLRYRLGFAYRVVKNVYTTVTTEVYLEIPDLELPLNKTSLDVELRITDVFNVELFYMVESSLQREIPLFNYIIGFKLEISPLER
jgi:hypothetical protein